MNQQIKVRFEIPDDVVRKAAERLGALAQRAEMTIHDERRADEELFSSISQEILVRLNEEVPTPKIQEVVRVVDEVFRKHFGTNITLDVSQSPSVIREHRVEHVGTA
jgi:hypothetical protein